MNWQYNRQITISTASSRKSLSWKPQSLTVAELYARLEVPVRGTETLSDYLALKKGQQDDLKDVGGFVGGILNGGRRKADAVIGRDVVTLDFDTIPPYSTQSVVQSVDQIGYGYCIYSTRKHTQTAPRLRVIMALDRTASADEYEAVARQIASKVGIQMADPSTFEACRLMYWPSCCADSEYLYTLKDAPLVPVDEVLGWYADWRNWQEWPQVPGANQPQKLAAKQEDPETKSGIVGAFNRTYDIPAAMGAFLPGLYDACDGSNDRFTYTQGSTTGGAILYDNGKFLYSHHSTDPCGGKLVNAFDLVRLHKFGDQDDSAAADTPINRLPSFKAMCDFASNDSAVKVTIVNERRAEAQADFVDVPTADEQENPAEADGTAWMMQLDVASSGAVKSTIDNVRIILENDPLLKGKFALNKFAGRGEVLDALPWSADTHRRMWSDTDNNGLYWYLEKFYRITGRGNTDAALDVHAATHAFNEVQDFINALEWDGTPRLDTLFIDYLGAEDTPYNRAVCRKSFTAAVTRAMEPGCKYDNMLILCGAQGLGKSTLLDKMSRGWFNDSIHTFEGKEASELLQGVWIVEVAELDAFRRTEVSRIKQFLSLRADRYRAAYGRNVKELPRCCVFFGTCNQMDFLQDTTGNRRFWPVDVGVHPHTKTVWRDLTDPVINQIWAEAKARWQLGEAVFLTGDAEREATDRQEQHREATPREGLIQEFAERKIPEDWAKWTVDQRRDYWSGGARGDYKLVDRDRITAVEVWCELFCKPVVDAKSADTREINAVLASMPGWKRSEKPFRAGPYNVQRGFVRDG